MSRSPQHRQRVAVVTGGGSGMGRALAESLAADGAHVAVCGRRAEPLDETVERCEALGARALAVPTDVRDPEAVQACVDRVVAELGPPELLVNSAAGNFICPCHGGVYDFQGIVVGGPPVRPLDRFYTRIRAGVVEVGPRQDLGDRRQGRAQSRIDVWRDQEQPCPPFARNDRVAERQRGMADIGAAQVERPGEVVRV